MDQKQIERLLKKSIAELKGLKPDEITRLVLKALEERHTRKEPPITDPVPTMTQEDIERQNESNRILRRKMLDDARKDRN